MLLLMESIGGRMWTGTSFGTELLYQYELLYRYQVTPGRVTGTSFSTGRCRFCTVISTEWTFKRKKRSGFLFRFVQVCK